MVQPIETIHLPAIIPSGPDWPFHCAVRSEAEAVGLKSIEWVKSLNIYDEKVLQTFWKYRMDILVGWSLHTFSNALHLITYTDCVFPQQIMHGLYTIKRNTLKEM